MFGLSLLKALFFTAGPKYSWKKATLVITLSSTFVMGLALCGYLIQSKARGLQVKLVAGPLQAIVQTGSQSGVTSGMKFSSLPTGFLAEALDLNTDCPVPFCQFDLEMARERLLATHIIENVRLKKMKPNLLFVDYTLREPWVYLEDYTNTVMDASGFFFPIIPFYSPRSLPCIYLGEHAPPDPWGGQMFSEYLSLALKVYAALPCETIERMDLSQGWAPIAGKREIVITIKGGAILRLTPKNCVQQLSYYSILKMSHLYRQDQQMIIDLRIPEVAYIQKISSNG